MLSKVVSDPPVLRPMNAALLAKQIDGLLSTWLPVTPMLHFPRVTTVTLLPPPTPGLGFPLLQRYLHEQVLRQKVRLRSLFLSA